MAPVPEEHRKQPRYWLKDRPEATRQSEAAILAHRAACRLLPHTLRNRDERFLEGPRWAGLPLLRVLLMAQVAIRDSDDDVRKHLAVLADTPGPLDQFGADWVRVAAGAASVRVVRPGVQDTFVEAKMHYERDVSIWEEVYFDQWMIAQGKDLFDAPLWSAAASETFKKSEAEMREAWRASIRPELWDFWSRWWLSILEGQSLQRNVLQGVARLPDYVWRSGPSAVAAEIRRIEAARAVPPEPDLRDEITRLPPAPAGQVEAVREAMVRNRAVLPPTFDAIEGLILLELQRLQQRNDVSDEDRRLMALFLVLHQAVTGLRAALPAAGPVTQAQAETSVGLLSLYLEKLRALPREKANEVVEGIWSVGRGAVQLGLIGASATLATAYGLPFLAAVALGAMVFARGQADAILKTARDIVAAPRS